MAKNSVKIKKNKNGVIQAIEMQTKKPILIEMTTTEHLMLITSIKYDIKKDDFIFSGINLYSKKEQKIKASDFSKEYFGNDSSYSVCFSNIKDWELASKEIGKMAGLVETDASISEEVIDKKVLSNKMTELFMYIVAEFSEPLKKIGYIEKFIDSHDKTVSKTSNNLMEKKELSLDPVLD